MNIYGLEETSLLKSDLKCFVEHEISSQEMKAFFQNAPDATKNKSIIPICTSLDAHQWLTRS